MYIRNNSRTPGIEARLTRIKAMMRLKVPNVMITMAAKRMITPWRSGVAETCRIGWHYLSNATCLMQPHLFSTALLV